MRQEVLPQEPKKPHEPGLPVLRTLSATERAEAEEWLACYWSNVNAPDFNKEEALHTAVNWQHELAFLRVLEFKPDFTHETSRQTIMAEALFYHNVPMITALIAAGYDIEYPCDYWGHSTLQAYSGTNRSDKKRAHSATITRLLLDVGANVEGNKDAKSPLTYACEERDLGLVRMLLEAGADVNARNPVIGYKDMTPLGYLLQSGKIEAALKKEEIDEWAAVVALLRQYGGKEHNRRGG